VGALQCCLFLPCGGGSAPSSDRTPLALSGTLREPHARTSVSARVWTSRQLLPGNRSNSISYSNGAGRDQASSRVCSHRLACSRSSSPDLSAVIITMAAAAGAAGPIAVGVPPAHHLFLLLCIDDDTVPQMSHIFATSEEAAMRHASLKRLGPRERSGSASTSTSKAKLMRMPRHQPRDCLRRKSQPISAAGRSTSSSSDWTHRLSCPLRPHIKGVTTRGKGRSIHNKRMRRWKDREELQQHSMLPLPAAIALV
jgi:hypothetical protein